MAAATYADGTLSEYSFHSRNFPMWAVSVSEVLRMRAPVQQHEELLRSGQLVLHEPEFFTIFISHQWLGLHHPDPDGSQLQVLQEALGGCISGRLLTESDSVSRAFVGNRAASSNERLAMRNGYIWLDWFCIPQDSAQQANQQLAIKSILSYVDSCSFFMALVPRLLHESGKTCDYESWLRRGWCLAELWCTQLSSRRSLPMIAIRGPDAADFVQSVNWVYSPPHEGEFTLEADRSRIRDMLTASLQCRIAFLEVQKTQPALCRYLKGRFHDWADAEPCHTQRSEEDFLSHFGFPSLAKGLKVRNVGALACAVLSDNIPMIQRLVHARASMRTRCKPLMNVDVLTWTPLHLAVQRGSRALPVMAELLRLKADPNSTDTLGLPLLGNSRDAATVEFLVRNHADVNFQSGVSKVSPLGLSAARVSPASVLSKLLELRADVNGSEARGGLGHSALVNLTWESKTVQNGGAELAALLVSARADVNAPGRPTGLFRLLELGFRAAVFLGSRSSFASFHANSSSCALGYAALSGHAPMVSLLLASRADPDLPNSRGATPRQLADAQTQPFFCEENSHDWDLPTECTQKPLRSSSSDARSGPAHLSGSPSPEALVVVVL